MTGNDTVEVFPKDNPRNLDISKYPVHPDSAQFLRNMSADKPLHPDFGTAWQGTPIGIPYVVVKQDQKRVPVRFKYASESDLGPYPIPPQCSDRGWVEWDR